MSLPNEARATLGGLARLVDGVEGHSPGLKTMFCGRDAVVDLMQLAIVAQEHLLLLGPPGTAKSEIVASFAARCKARFFHYLLTRYTEPAELFGPMDVEAFKKGEYLLRTEGMLPQAEIAFLDEVFQGSSAILNSLLTLVHERRFHHGARRDAVPLLSLFGAANELPEDPTLRAFSDRFLLRLTVEPVPESGLKDLLDRGWALETGRIKRQDARAPRVEVQVDTDELRKLHALLPTVKLGGVRPIYDDLLRQIRTQGVKLSDRRMVKSLKLVAAAALLDGRDEAGPKDLWPLKHVWTEAAEMSSLAEVVDRHLASVGAAITGGRRKLEELEAELVDLEQREAGVRNELILGAHLRALGRLRQELIADHGGAEALLARIDAAVGRLMQRLG